MKDYLTLLEEAYNKLKKLGKELKRGEDIVIPLPKITYYKKWTYIENVKEILEILRRDIKLLAKFLQKELNIPCKVEENKILIQKEVSLETIKNKIDKFIEIFVKCPVCKKLDTQIIKLDRNLILKCEACGAESSIVYNIKK
ncbi:MAG: translation initiation factor IF-2 subunit beta [Candidatus Aenigmatarchaeota archaeon]